MTYNFILYLKTLYTNSPMDLTDDRFKAQINLGTCTLVANLSKRIIKELNCLSSLVELYCSSFSFFMYIKNCAIKVKIAKGNIYFNSLVVSDQQNVKYFLFLES